MSGISTIRICASRARTRRRSKKSKELRPFRRFSGALWAELSVFLTCVVGCGGSGGSTGVIEEALIIEQRDVAYSAIGNEVLFLDIYRSEAASPTAPAVLLFHGGGWIAGDKRDEAGTAREIARKGYVALAVNYRLAANDENHFPASIEDSRNALRWARRNAELLGIDPNRIAAMGVSAGGLFSELLGTGDTALQPVQCAIGIAAPSDLTAEFPEEPVNFQLVVDFVLGSFPAEEASPILQITPGSAAFLLFHAPADEIVPYDQSTRMNAALIAAGVSSKLVPLPNSAHAVTNETDLLLIQQETSAFLKSCFSEED